MISTFKKLLLCFVFSFGVAAPLASCGSTSNLYQATALEFVSPSFTLKVGDRQSLKYNIAPAAARNADAFWSTSNDTIAYVSEGVLIGVGTGTARIGLVTANKQTFCDVTVIDQGGGGDTESIVLSNNTLTLEVDATSPLTAYVNPKASNVTWTSSNEEVAKYASGVVTAIAVGTCTITASLDSGLKATCDITVKSKSVDPDPGTGGYSGNIRVGAPLGEIEFMKGLLNDFNTSTGSTVTFEVTQWEEGNGADNLPQSLGDGPDIFPYVSDQTVSFYQRNALAALPKSSINFIKNDMGDDALNYASLKGSNKVIGYPFASDNGYIMFYSKKAAQQAGIADMSDVTMEELLSKADAAGLDFDFPITNAFYAAGSLMSYTGGESLYNLSMKSGGTSYTVTSNFACDNGVKAAMKIRELFKHSSLLTVAECPGVGPNKGVLATIVDCSKVSAFKLELKDDYGVAPLPYIDDTKTARYADYLGYKFYGINPGRAADHINTAHAVAKFLVSDYAQQKRFEQLKVKPTLKTLLDPTLHPEITEEPHIKALNAQGKANTIALTAVDSSLWSQAAVAVKQIQALDAGAQPAEYKSILEDLDVAISG